MRRISPHFATSVALAAFRRIRIMQLSFHLAPAVSSVAFLHAAWAGSGERGGFMTAE